MNMPRHVHRAPSSRPLVPEHDVGDASEQPQRAIVVGLVTNGQHGGQMRIWRRPMQPVQPTRGATWRRSPGVRWKPASEEYFTSGPLTLGDEPFPFWTLSPGAFTEPLARPDVGTANSMPLGATAAGQGTPEPGVSGTSQSITSPAPADAGLAAVWPGMG